jgi:hypothetical protein
MLRFAGIVRTQGSRSELLSDTLQSIALQQFPCHAIVVVHGDGRRYEEVRNTFQQSGTVPVVVLHAPDTSRRRGHPINVGLDYCAAELPETDFVFFLDDDDIVYPFFTDTMAAAVVASEADVVYAASNRRSPGQPTEPAYSPEPIHHLLPQNFIPINSYAVRFPALLRSGVRMSEEMEYTEDWYFLLQLLKAGLRFHALPVTLSEFRITSDGNLQQKKDPAAWKAISLELRGFINSSLFPIPGGELVRWAAQPNVPAPFRQKAPTRQPPAAEIAPPQLQMPAASDARLVAELHQRIWALEHSLSWRCTAPLRSALGLILGLRRQKVLRQ